MIVSRITDPSPSITTQLSTSPSSDEDEALPSEPLLSNCIYTIICILPSLRKEEDFA